MVVWIFFSIFAVDFENKCNLMGKNWWKYIVLFALAILVAKPIFAADETVLPVVEMRPDRVVIYPQRMELNGEETLFDMLQLYPDLLTNAYDNWLSDCELRIDNGPYGGDMRVLLNEMKASRIKMIQISDDPGVAKGTTGMKKVVDVFLLPLEKGAHGTVSAEISHGPSTTPFAEFRYGSEKTDILANASYNYQHVSSHDNHRQYSNFHMVNNFSEKDQLVTYFTQSYEQTYYYKVREGIPVVADHYRKNNRFFSGQLRHYHYFTPQMSLMSAIVYQNGTYPDTKLSLKDYKTPVSRYAENLNVFAAVEEFNATFFDKFNLMAGLEADFVKDDNDQEGKLNDFNSNCFNADLYVEVDYSYKNWRFTAGDRVRYYRYHVMLGYSDPYFPADNLEHRCHNLLHASVIYTPLPEHQLQVAYARKYQSPAYTQLKFDEKPINEVKLAYGFARPNLSVRLNAYYYFYNDDFYNAGRVDLFRVNATAYYRYKFFSISGGVKSYMTTHPDVYKSLSAAFTLSPVFDIPYGMQVKARAIFYTPGCPARAYHVATLSYAQSGNPMYSPYIDRPVYGELQFTKFWPMVDVYALWHDIFNGSYGIATVGCRVKL